MLLSLIYQLESILYDKACYLGKFGDLCRIIMYEQINS